jgi:hypothetical protein
MSKIKVLQEYGGDDAGYGKYQIEIVRDTSKIEEYITACQNDMDAIDVVIAGLDPDDDQIPKLRLRKASLATKKKNLERTKDRETIVDAYLGDIQTGLKTYMDANSIEFTAAVCAANEPSQIPMYDDEEDDGLMYMIYSPGCDFGDVLWGLSLAGQVQAVEGSTSAAVFYNLAMLPGTQRWRPCFRWGKILSMDITTGETVIGIYPEYSSVDDILVSPPATDPLDPLGLYEITVPSVTPPDEFWFSDIFCIRPEHYSYHPDDIVAIEFIEKLWTPDYWVIGFPRPYPKYDKHYHVNAGLGSVGGSGAWTRYRVHKFYDNSSLDRDEIIVAHLGNIYESGDSWSAYRYSTEYEFDSDEQVLTLRCRNSFSSIVIGFVDLLVNIWVPTSCRLAREIENKINFVYKFSGSATYGYAYGYHYQVMQSGVRYILAYQEPTGTTTYTRSLVEDFNPGLHTQRITDTGNFNHYSEFTGKTRQFYLLEAYLYVDTESSGTLEVEMKINFKEA